MKDKQLLLWNRRLGFANRVQFLLVLLLQFLLPLYGFIYYDSGGAISFIGTAFLYYEVSASGLAVNLWTLVLAGFALYLIVFHREDRLFEFLPFSLLPLLVPQMAFFFAGGIWLWGTSGGFPSAALTPYAGYLLLIVSVFASLTLTVASLLIEGQVAGTPPPSPTPIPMDDVRTAVVLFLVSVMPVAATVPPEVAIDPSVGLLSLLLTPSQNYYYLNYLGVPVGYFNTLLASLLFETLALVAALIALQRPDSRRTRNIGLALLLILVIGLVFLPFPLHPWGGTVAPIWLLILAVCPWLFLPYALVLRGGRNNSPLREGLFICLLVISIGTIVLYASSAVGIVSIFGPQNYRPTPTLLVIPFLARRLWQSRSLKVAS